ncbi:MAG: flagellar filament outer layer protein FlaA [Treponema sp.]|jgi:hypothetical protein|nr:flagellar filament outer layer protein FlaA [Treponema sp.]
MKKFVFVALLMICTVLIAQEPPAPAPEVGTVNSGNIGVETAQTQLQEVSVDKFEYDGFWTARMSTDEGYTRTRLFEGGPAAKQPIPEEQGQAIPDQYVLGVRVDFLRRGIDSFYIYAQRPIPVAGITKSISVWVAGRNFNHELFVLVKDFFGHDYELSMGRLNFQGWKKLTVQVPPQISDGTGTRGIVQKNYHYTSQMGIQIVGFRIDCDPVDAFGSYYVYFDDLRVETDLFAENNRDEDDPVDSW